MKSLFLLFIIGINFSCKKSLETSGTSAASQSISSSSQNTFESLIAREKILGSDKKLGQDPMAELLKALGTLGNIAYTMIPHGRSIQAPHSDDKDPRIVLTISQQNPKEPLLAHGRIFIGYARKANQLEIIAYNEEAGRYDFQIMTDFRPGGLPQLSTPSRTLCTTCHQGGGPIFSIDPWSETSSAGPKGFALESDDRVRKQLVKTLGQETYQGLSLKRFDRYNQYGTTMIHESEPIGIMGISASFGILALSEAWRQCGQSNITCREDLLLTVLNNRFKNPKSPLTKIDEFISKAAQSAQIIDGVISDRKPDKNGVFLPVTAEEDPKASRPVNTFLQMTSTLPLEVFFLAKQRLDRSSLASLLSGHGTQSILQANQFPFAALFAMATNQKWPVEIENSRPDLSPPAAPTPKNEPKQLSESTVQSPGLKLLYRYCGECHSGSAVPIEQFLKGDREILVLGQVRALLPEIVERIQFPKADPRAMPAPSSTSEEFYGTKNGLTHMQKIKLIIDLDHK